MRCVLLINNSGYPQYACISALVRIAQKNATSPWRFFFPSPAIDIRDAILMHLPDDRFWQPWFAPRITSAAGGAAVIVGAVRHQILKTSRYTHGQEIVRFLPGVREASLESTGWRIGHTYCVKSWIAID